MAISKETELAIQSTHEAAKRARFVFLILQITVVLVFMAFWQSRQSAWPISRLRVATAAVWVLNGCDDVKKPPSADDDVKKPPSADCAVTPNERDLQGAREFLKNYPLDLEQAKRHVLELQTNWVQKVLNPQVPFLWISYDINDLSNLGGVAFIMLLMWLRFSLWRESENIRLVFKRAESHKELEDVYELLSMSQVLSIPPKLTEKDDRRPLAILPDLLLVFPLLVQIIVIWHDYKTLGFAVVQRFANLQFWVSLALAFVILWLTWNCFRIDHHMDKQWQETAGRVAAELAKAQAAAAPRKG